MIFHEPMGQISHSFSALTGPSTMPGLQKVLNKCLMDELVLTSSLETCVALSICRLNSEEFH